ncbi:MAG: hypothetical protein EZS26_000104 [Candidatus Ordinivivax streblomastigis]|uniref:DUF4325 domain-containing protein n=1 Tax=Candidatus Ordinivivax streblomastigis TaxID=2540710 RepID=A0A5M8P503_9BACT|nr:MAG: hypothetical protein EZS26_000104 [Candidatus Ordinivivax streblomastigis]
MKVILKEILEDRSYTEGGTVLFQIAEIAVNTGDTVYVDMQDVTAIPTLFMNTSFGNLMDKYGIDKIKKLFRFNNATRIQINRIQKYFNDFQILYNQLV